MDPLTRVVQDNKDDILEIAKAIKTPVPDRKSGEFDTPCLVCMDNASIVLYLPCKHLCCCSVCSSLMKTCPLCERPIKHKISVYNG